VNPPEVLEDVNNTAVQLIDERSATWADGPSLDLFRNLDGLIYDIMGQVIFKGNWTDGARGQAIRKEHLYLIHWSSRYGMKVLETPSFKNMLCAASDCMEFFASIKRLRAIVGEMIDNRRKEIAADPKKFANDKGALTNLVTNPVSPKDKTPFFSQHMAVSSCIGLLNGAYDTTHSTSFWCFYHLARFPEFQKRLAAELDRVFGNGKPTLEKLRDCELLDSFIKESMRLRPTVPIGMRVPEEDIQIDGVHIPKGTTMMPFLDWREGQEQYYGAAPDEFRPDRFMGDGADAKAARKNFDRFGAYSRMCVGMTFALAELNAIVARVLQRFTIELLDTNMPEPEAIYEAGVYQPKEKFHFVFKKR
jgi:cytochrome P450